MSPQDYLQFLRFRLRPVFRALRQQCVWIASSQKRRVLPRASRASYFFLRLSPQEMNINKKVVIGVLRIYGWGFGKNQDADFATLSAGVSA